MRERKISSDTYPHHRQLNYVLLDVVHQVWF